MLRQRVLRGMMTMTWAEDRATLGSDPSAGPGAHTEVGAGTRRPSTGYHLGSAPKRQTHVGPADPLSATLEDSVSR